MDVLVIGGIFREVLDADTKPRHRYGGSGLTSSIAAARFGARVGLASYVGTEDEQAVRTELEVAGVDDSGVTSVAGACGTFVYPTHQHRRQLGPMYRPAEAVPVESRVPGSGVRGRGSGERETTASSLAGKEESSRKEDNGGQGKDGPA